MKTLVTGGAGFIGSHLVDSLLACGDEVWVIDDLSTGRLENVAHLEQHPRFHLQIDTILNQVSVGELVDRADIVFHLAAAVGVKYVIANPLKSLSTNIRGTEIILEEASRDRKKTIVFSSSEVYGKGNGVPFKEDDDRVLGPTGVSRWSYATGKAVDEFMAFAFWKEKGVPVVVLRCFNTCGPRQTGQYGMVVPRFMNQALSNEDIVVYGTGEQSRCFSYVGDVVRGVMDLADCDAAVGNVFNIGTDEESTINHLAKRVKVLTHSPSAIVQRPYEEIYGSDFEDMNRRVPDLTKINECVGYRPRVTLDELLLMTADHIRGTREMIPQNHAAGEQVAMQA